MLKNIIKALLVTVMAVLPVFAEENIENVQKYQFEVLSTTDMHGRATTTDVMTGKKEINSMAKVSTVVNNERKKFNNRVILIDNGDLLQGTLVSQYALTKKTLSENPMITALKDLKYDVWVMGNHEFNYSPEQREPQIKYAQNARIDVLGANIVLKTDGVDIDGNKEPKGTPYFKPYAIRTIKFDDNKSVRVAIIGLGNANNDKWDREVNYPNLQFSSIDNPQGLLEFEVEKWVSYIKKNNLADIIVVSAHSGKGEDSGAKFTKFAKESQIVAGAEKTSGVDLFIYGHDHQQNAELLKNKENKPVYIMNGGGTSVTKNVFYVDFDNDGNYKDCKVSAELISLADEKEDKILATKLNSWYNKAYLFYATPLGYFRGGWNNITRETKNKTNADLLLNQTHVNNFVHKAQIWSSWQNYKDKGIKGAEVSVASSVAAVDSDNKIIFVPKDNVQISVFELAMIYRFSNNILCMADMKPEQLYAWMSAVADKLEINKKGKAAIKSDQSEHGVDTFYGIDYVFDLTKPEGKRVVSAKINGENLLDRKTPVRVVLNTYRMSGCHGFAEATGLKESDSVWTATDYLTDEEANVQYQMGAYVKNKEPITPYDKIEHAKDSVWKILIK